MSIKVVTIADGFGAAPVPGVGGLSSVKSETYLVSNGQFIAKAIDVGDLVGALLLTWQGIAQTIGEDYYIDGTEIKWDGKNLDSVIDVGDEINIIYTDY